MRGLWWSVALGLFMVAIALWSLPTTIQAGDAGEFSTVLLKGGIAHPSGYPFMRLLGPLARLAHNLGMPAASAAALPSALLGALAIVCLARALQPSCGPLPSSLACVVLGLSPLYVAHVYDAEVWGPLMALAAGYVWFFLREPSPSPFWLGLMLGLGTAHHLTFVLLVPLAVGAAWPAPGLEPRQAFAPRLLRAGALGVLGSALGLCLYLTLFVGDPNPAAAGWRWGDMSSFEGWLHHVSRGDYGSTQLSHHDAQVGVLAQWSRSLGSLGSAFAGDVLAGRPVPTLGLMCLAFAAAWRGALAQLSLPKRWAWGAGLLLTTFAFPTLFDLDPGSPFAAWILERFDLLPALLWAATFAMAIAHVADRTQLKPLVLVPFALTCVGLCAMAGLPKRPALERQLAAYSRAVLQSADTSNGRAYILGTDDHRSFPILFAQEVEAHGKEVVYIDAALMQYPFYRARITGRFPEVPDIKQPARLALALQALPSQPPVYLANIMSRKSSQLPLIEEGLLLRVLREDELRQPDYESWTQAHLDALGRAARVEDVVLFAPQQSIWAGDVWGQVASHHATFVGRLGAAGRTDLAQRVQTWAPSLRD